METENKYIRKKTIGVYKITNIINGKVYIGASTNIESRVHQHKTQSKFRDTPFHKDIRKFGYDKFVREIIEVCTKENVFEREIYWIAEYRKTHDVYNILNGGKEGYGRVQSKETRSKISKTLTGRKNLMTEDGLKRKKQAMTGSRNHKSIKVFYDGKVYETIGSVAKKIGKSESTIAKMLYGKCGTKKEILEKGFYILGLEKSPYKFKDTEDTIECDGESFKSVVQCAEKYEVKIDTMRCWVSGKRNMPEKFKKLGLKKIGGKND